jgi:hypothetical protein
MVLDGLGDKFEHAPAGAAAHRIETPVDKAFQSGIQPRKFGGLDGRPRHRWHCWMCLLHRNNSDLPTR